MGRPRTVNVEHIVEAAARVFERRGYADATIADIAAEAQVSKPTVYQYVESKQRLLEIIVERVIHLLRDGIDKVTQAPGEAHEKLDAYVRVHVDSATRYKVYYLVLLADRQQLSTRGQRNYQAWAREVNLAAEQLLEDGISAGVVRADIDIPTAANLLNSTLNSIARWYRPGDRLDVAQIHDEVMKFLSGMILIPGSGQPARP
ncbi:MAG TPA: TetR/AcrR family transcriptional regulator [Pseudonocardia sp.]|jgi:AcrR family transcriptional regulator